MGGPARGSVGSRGPVRSSEAPFPGRFRSSGRPLVPPPGASRAARGDTRPARAISPHRGIRRTAPPRSSGPSRPAGRPLDRRRRRSERRARARDLDRLLAVDGSGSRDGGPVPAFRARGRGAFERARRRAGHPALGRGNRLSGNDRERARDASAVRHAGVPGNEVWKIMSGGASLRGTLDGLAFLAPAGGGPRLAPGGAGTVRARVALQDGRGSARLDAEASAVVVRFGKRALRGAIRANVFAHRIDFPGGSVAFDGTRVRLKDVSPEDASGTPWSGVARDTTGPARAHRTGLWMRFSRRDWETAGRSWPWCPPARRSGSRAFSISGTSRRRATCARRGSSLALSPAHAEAGTFSIDADWREARGRHWGALLVRKGALSLGLGLGENGTSLHLVGAAGWFAEEGRPGGLRTDQPRGSEAPGGSAGRPSRKGTLEIGESLRTPAPQAAARLRDHPRFGRSGIRLRHHHCEGGRPEADRLRAASRLHVERADVPAVGAARRGDDVRQQARASRERRRDLSRHARRHLVRPEDRELRGLHLLVGRGRHALPRRARRAGRARRRGPRPPRRGRFPGHNA